MKTTSLFDFIYSLDLENDQIVEFFVHFTDEILQNTVSGIKYGLELAGKDMDSDEGKEVMAEISSAYSDRLPGYAKNLVEVFTDYVLEREEENDFLSTLKGKNPEDLKPIDYVIPICKMLQKGYGVDKICEVLKYKNKLFISNIKNRRIYKNISKDYEW